MEAVYNYIDDKMWVEFIPENEKMMKNMILVISIITVIFMVPTSFLFEDLSMWLLGITMIFLFIPLNLMIMDTYRRSIIQFGKKGDLLIDEKQIVVPENSQFKLIRKRNPDSEGSKYIWELIVQKQNYEFIINAFHNNDTHSDVVETYIHKIEKWLSIDIMRDISDSRNDILVSWDGEPEKYEPEVLDHQVKPDFNSAENFKVELQNGSTRISMRPQHHKSFLISIISGSLAIGIGIIAMFTMFGFATDLFEPYMVKYNLPDYTVFSLELIVFILSLSVMGGIITRQYSTKLIVVSEDQISFQYRALTKKIIRNYAKENMISWKVCETQGNMELHLELSDNKYGKIEISQYNSRLNGWQLSGLIAYHWD